MSTGGRPETRVRILGAARTMFEEFGYHDASLGAIAKRAAVSRQAIYLHFPSKVELLAALHAHIFETEVVPALHRHPIAATTNATEAVDARVAAFVEIADRVWQIHEALSAARRHHPEVDETLRPGEAQRYGALLELGEHLRTLHALPPESNAASFAEDMWGLTSTGMYQSMVIELRWPRARYQRWLATTIRRYIGIGDDDEVPEDLSRRETVRRRG